MINVKFDPVMNLELSVEDLLVKDYKFYSYPKANVGYSVLLFRPEDLIKKHGWDEIHKIVKEFDQQNKVDLHFLMFVWFEKEHTFREFVMVSESQELIQNLKKYIIEEAKLQFEENLNAGEGKSVTFIRDLTSTCSRKLFEPHINKYFSS